MQLATIKTEHILFKWELNRSANMRRQAWIGRNGSRAAGLSGPDQTGLNGARPATSK
jgi:hypothetical protein